MRMRKFLKRMSADVQDEVFFVVHYIITVHKFLQKFIRIIHSTISLIIHYTLYRYINQNPFQTKTALEQPNRISLDHLSNKHTSILSGKFYD